MAGNNQSAKLLTSIPGISYVLALTIMAEIGTIKRFKSAKKLQGYAGLVPSTYASGERTVYGRLAKTGSRWLRWAMIEIVQRQLLCKKKPGFGWYYQRVKKRKGSVSDSLCLFTSRAVTATAEAYLIIP